MTEIKDSVELTDMDVIESFDEDYSFESDLELGDVENGEQQFDLSEFTPSVCNQKGRAAGKAGVISIVHSKNGMRVALSKELMQRLGEPQSVQIGLSQTQIAISSHLGDSFTSYPCSQSGTKSIIYRGELVKEITDRYQLDFRDRTSITFTDATYQNMGNNVVALISVN